MDSRGIVWVPGGRYGPEGEVGSCAISHVSKDI